MRHAIITESVRHTNDYCRGAAAQSNIAWVDGDGGRQLKMARLLAWGER